MTPTRRRTTAPWLQETFGVNCVRACRLLLRREGWRVNLKRIRRLYRLEGLQVRLRARKHRHRSPHRGAVPLATGRRQRWSMDFVHDQLADRRAFRVLTVVDQWSRESRILEVIHRVTGADVATALDRLRATTGLPCPITVDHGKEFTSQALDSGPTRTAWPSTSPDWESRPTMGISNRLTRACGTNA